MKKLKFILVISGLFLILNGTSIATTFPGESLTTSNLNQWGGYNSTSYGLGWDINYGSITAEFRGVNMEMIKYLGDFGWPPDPTDVGASVIVGFYNPLSGDYVQYSVKSNMSGNKPRGTIPETYGKGSWNQQNVGHWNDDGYRSYLFQGQYSNAPSPGAVYGNSQYNAEKRGGPNGNDPDYDSFNIKMEVVKTAPNTYTVTAWHQLWKSSAIDEGCYWDWNYAMNAHDPAKRGYLKVFEGSWIANNSMDLDIVKPFLAIQNWQYTQPYYHTFDWDGVEIYGAAQAIPEPGTLLLLGTGLLSLGVIGIIRRKK